MKKKVEALLRHELEELAAKGILPAEDNVAVSIPQNKDFGDFSTNVSMIMASKAKKNPREIAVTIVEAIKEHDLFATVEIAGPGFINFALKPSMWAAVLADIVRQREAYGRSDFGGGKKVQVEFVSANPTGPLHVGHGRGAAVGDSLVRLLDAAGFDVQAEYYINDVGNQMNTLGRSVLTRYKQLLGQDVAFPEEGYQGDYIKDLAAAMQERHADGLLDLPEDQAIATCREYAAATILDGIRADLELFSVNFDNWFSEGSLYRDNKVETTLSALREKDMIYEEGGALWFKSSAYGDEKDRVVKKQDGSLTYFAPDIAYHKDKLDRGFAQVIDIWGADHHGYVPRMSAAIQSLGAGKDSFHALLIQMVSLVREGTPVYMSTRAGEFITLREILDEVGKDAARYFFLMRKCDSQLTFDLELAKKKTEENPVFYIQYAHARICSILRNAAAEGLKPELDDARLTVLESEDDQELIKLLATYPDLLEAAAAALEPHRISFYLLELATVFHRFYNKNRVISDDRDLSVARLILMDAVRQVIANALGIMGISAPERM